MASFEPGNWPQVLGAVW